MEEIIQNENLVEVATEEVTTVKTGKAAKVVVGVGLTALVGGIMYKRVIKPIIAKIKAKKMAKEPKSFEETLDNLNRMVKEDEENLDS